MGQRTRRGPVQAGRFLGSEHVWAAVPEQGEGENRRAGPESRSGGHILTRAGSAEAHGMTGGPPLGKTVD